MAKNRQWIYARKPNAEVGPENWTWRMPVALEALPTVSWLEKLIENTGRKAGAALPVSDSPATNILSMFKWYVS